MRFRRDAPVVLGIGIAAGVGGVAWCAARLAEEQVADVEAAQFSAMRSTLEFNLKGAESRALARAEMVADLPTVRQAFAARDRDALLAETAELYQVQADKYGVDQAQFHTPPATSFLRLNKPAQFGEDLSTFRPLVVSVNADGIARSGISIGRSGPGIFGVVPMRDPAGQQDGSFEVGIAFGPVLDGMKAAYGFDLAVYILEQPLKDISTSIDPAIFDDQNRTGAYVKLHATNWPLLHGLVTSEELALVDGDPVQYVGERDGTSYGVVLVGIRNPAGKALGVAAVAQDFSGSRAAAAGTRASLVSAAVAVTLVLWGLLQIVIRGFLLRPLAAITDRFRLLAGGDRSTPFDASDAPCEELEALGRAYEQLRGES